MTNKGYWLEELRDLTVEELRDLAQEKGIKNANKKSKETLLKELGGDNE